MSNPRESGERRRAIGGTAKGGLNCSRPSDVRLGGEQRHQLTRHFLADFIGTSLLPTVRQPKALGEEDRTTR